MSGRARPSGLMPTFWLRSAGFPFAWLDALRAPRAFAIARSLVAGEAALDELAAALRAEVATASARAPRAFERALEQRTPLADTLPGAGRWNAAIAGVAERRAALDAAVAGELPAARAAVHALLGDPRAREAIHAMSRGALVMFDSLRARGVGARDAKTRYREVEATLFLQRLCTKNETVSFFGPLVLGARAAETTVVPSSGAVVDRLVSLEHWAVRALADAVNRTPELADDLPLRLNPACRLDGAILFYPDGDGVELAGATGRVAGAIAAGGASRRSLLAGGGDGAAIAAELDGLLAARVVERGCFPPTMMSRAEEWLREQVAGLAASPAGDSWLAALDDLLGQRDAWAAARGDERARLAAELDARFEALTGAAATRGAASVGRSILYEDCVIDGAMTLGDAAARRIERTLAPLAGICGWIARDVAAAVERGHRAVFESLGGREVDLLRFARAARAVEAKPALVAPTVERLRHAWSAVVPDDARDDILLDDAQLAEVVRRLPSPALTGDLVGADVHAPDLLLAAPDRAAIERGDFLIVLGEIHKMVFYEAHPVSWPLRRDRADVAARAAALLPPDLPRLMDAPALHTSRGYHHPAGTVIDVVVPGTSARPGGRSIAIGELSVALTDEGLVVRQRGSQRSAPLASVLQNLVYHLCDLVPPVPSPADRGYLPRISTAQAVLRRRTWRPPASALEELRRASTPAEVLVAGARLSHRDGLPARVFASTPAERKPVFIDLESPLSVELLVKLARKATSMKLTECLPDADGLWWRVDGRAHTSELRLTLVGAPEPEAVREVREGPG